MEGWADIARGCGGDARTCVGGGYLEQGVGVGEDLRGEAEQQHLLFPGDAAGQHGLASRVAPAVGVVLRWSQRVHQPLVARSKPAHTCRYWYAGHSFKSQDNGRTIHPEF